MMNFRLRSASNEKVEAELSRILAFQNKYRHKFVRERDPSILKDAIERSSFLLLEDEPGELHGTCAQVSHADGQYSETGIVRVLLNGFGIQTLMMGIAAITEYLLSPPERDIFAITASDNDGSIKSILRAGFVSHKEDSRFLQTLGMSEFPPSKRLFRFDRLATAAVRRQLVDLAKSCRITKGGQTVSIIPDVPLLRGTLLELLEDEKHWSP
jgi:hypothetical protein